MRDLERMGEIGLARFARLRLMLLGGKFEGAAQNLHVFVGAILADHVEQSCKAALQTMLRQHRAAYGKQSWERS